MQQFLAVSSYRDVDESIQRTACSAEMSKQLYKEHHSLLLVVWDWRGFLHEAQDTRQKITSFLLYLLVLGTVSFKELSVLGGNQICSCYNFFHLLSLSFIYAFSSTYCYHCHLHMHFPLSVLSFTYVFATFHYHLHVYPHPHPPCCHCHIHFLSLVSSFTYTFFPLCYHLHVNSSLPLLPFT